MPKACSCRQCGRLLDCGYMNFCPDCGEKSPEFELGEFFNTMGQSFAGFKREECEKGHPNFGRIEDEEDEPFVFCPCCGEHIKQN